MAKSTFQFISQYTNDAYNFSDIWAIATDGQKFGNGSGESSYGSSFSSGDILQLAFDLDNGKFYAGKNGTYFNSGDPAGGTNAAFTNVPTGESMQPFYGSSTSGASHTFNFGQDSSFAGNPTHRKQPTQMATVTAALPTHRQADTLPSVRRTCQTQLSLMALRISTRCFILVTVLVASLSLVLDFLPIGYGLRTEQVPMTML